jgi:hypothetical protein
VTCELVGKNAEENQTVDHIEQLLAVAKSDGYEVFVSPHYYFPHDHQWEFGGTLEKKMREIGVFDRSAFGPCKLQDSGADWLDRFKPYLEDGRTVVCSPHKVYGPEQNDLVLQVSQAGDQQGHSRGVSANLCVESHLRELLEQGLQQPSIPTWAMGMQPLWLIQLHCRGCPVHEGDSSGAGSLIGA